LVAITVRSNDTAVRPGDRRPLEIAEPRARAVKPSDEPTVVDL
jgi:hypothetical protein